MNKKLLLSVIIILCALLILMGVVIVIQSITIMGMISQKSGNTLQQGITTSTATITRDVTVGATGVLSSEFGDQRLFETNNPNILFIKDSSKGTWIAQSSGTADVIIKDSDGSIPIIISLNVKGYQQSSPIQIEKGNFVKISNYVNGVINGVASRKTSVVEAQYLDSEWVIIGVEEGLTSVVVTTFDGSIYELDVTVVEN